ncbi:MAG: hypothetical protein E4H16_04345 [Candidatus Atribacteria bacterium]|nr:MAG: hypothetical protein E4H16_04345 [Candidatus Atribacteria bacterium]
MSNCCIWTPLKEYADNQKARAFPGKVGTFRFLLSTLEFKKYGGYLTFLSFTPDPDYPMVGIGTDIGNKIHGVLQIKTCAGNKGFKNGFAMDIIRAKIVESEE